MAIALKIASQYQRVSLSHINVNQCLCAVLGCRAGSYLTDMHGSSRMHDTTNSFSPRSLNRPATANAAATSTRRTVNFSSPPHMHEPPRASQASSPLRKANRAGRENTYGKFRDDSIMVIVSNWWMVYCKT